MTLAKPRLAGRVETLRVAQMGCASMDGGAASSGAKFEEPVMVAYDTILTPMAVEPGSPEVIPQAPRMDLCCLLFVVF